LGGRVSSEGTFTFLFTDIEGSTRMLQRLGPEYARVLADHHRLLRAACGAHNGREERTEGDAFFVVFTSAAAAIAACVDAQHALAAHPWPDGGEVRVRMGLHTGVATGEVPGSLVGIAVHQAARICSAGHGGQVLVSAATAALARDALPEGIVLVDLGPHRLKDLLEPIPLYQLAGSGLARDFPPLTSLSVLPHNLPVQRTSFVGRERELLEIRKLLGDGGLVTLTGTGGCGKTRLAIQVAAESLDDWTDGVWLVELAALDEPDLVSRALARTLGVRDEPGRALTGTLVDHLRHKALLLVLDNCEHLGGACAELAHVLLRECPAVAILATSREPLNVSGETMWRVPSLATPDGGEDATAEALFGFDAVRLFLDRARGAEPRFTFDAATGPAVAHICSRLDGIPLALELAAARVRVMPVAELATRLDDRFRLLTLGERAALPRQQTLRGTLDWSYDLLSDTERTVFARISVFAGGFSVAAMEAVCGRGLLGVDVVDILAALVDKSLVIFDLDTGRYRLLETVREYASQRLDEFGDDTTLRDAHLEWFVDLVGAAPGDAAAWSEGQWFERFEADHDNLRAALTWADHTHGADALVGLAHGLFNFWEGGDGGAHAEARHWLTKALHCIPGDSELRPVLLNEVGGFALWQGDYDEGRAQIEEGLELSRARGDRENIAASLTRLGQLQLMQGDYAAAARSFEEELVIGRELGHRVLMAVSNYQLGSLALRVEDDARAREHFEEALELFRDEGDASWTAASLRALGVLALRRGDDTAARSLLQEGVDRCREIGFAYPLASALLEFGLMALRQDDRDAAGPHLEEAQKLYEELGDPDGHSKTLRALGDLALREGDHGRARAYLERALALARPTRLRLVEASALHGLAELARREGNAQQAREGFVDALALRRELREKDDIAATIHALGRLDVESGDPARGVQLMAAADAVRAASPVVLSKYQREARGADHAQAHAVVGDAAFETAWGRGQSLSLDDAAALAATTILDLERPER
jgi:predicted ATPase/class 3 adenylate cyclase